MRIKLWLYRGSSKDYNFCHSYTYKPYTSCFSGSNWSQDDGGTALPSSVLNMRCKYLVLPSSKSENESSGIINLCENTQQNMYYKLSIHTPVSTFKLLMKGAFTYKKDRTQTLWYFT